MKWVNHMFKLIFLDLPPPLPHEPLVAHAASPMAIWFGPNRPAADMEGNGKFEFLGFLEIYGKFEEFWRNWFIEEKKVIKRTSIKQRPPYKL